MNNDKQQDGKPDFETMALNITNDNGEYAYCSKGNHDHDCQCGALELGLEAGYTLGVQSKEKEIKELREDLKRAENWNPEKQSEYNANAVSVAVAEATEELEEKISNLTDELKRYKLVAEALPFAKDKIAELTAALKEK